MTDTTETPKPNRRVLAKAATRKKVRDAAKTLFERDGFEKATIRDIAKEAGMSTGAVFASFEDKAALYRSLYGHEPVPQEVGAVMLHILRGFALNAKSITVRPQDDVFASKLTQLLELAQGAVAHSWPQGIVSDVDGSLVADPARVGALFDAYLAKDQTIDDQGT